MMHIDCAKRILRKSFWPRMGQAIKWRRLVTPVVNRIIQPFNKHWRRIMAISQQSSRNKSNRITSTLPHFKTCYPWWRLRNKNWWRERSLPKWLWKWHLQSRPSSMHLRLIQTWCKCWKSPWSRRSRILIRHLIQGLSRQSIQSRL